MSSRVSDYYTAVECTDMPSTSPCQQSVNEKKTKLQKSVTMQTNGGNSYVVVSLMYKTA